LLAHLNFGFNALKGEFPSFIPKCRNLTFLSLFSNDFRGLILESLFTRLSKLHYLELWDDKFVGPISPNISKLSNLTVLDLRRNQLTGLIPESIGFISGLKVLELSDNSLTGSIPPALMSCTMLTNLSLAKNSLFGELPSSLTNLKGLLELWLSNNNLFGKLSHIYLPIGPNGLPWNFRTMESVVLSHQKLIN